MATSQRRAHLRALAPVFLIGVLMALLVTALVTYLNFGWQAGFVAHWLQAAALAVAIMLPIGGAVMAVISRAVDTLLRGASAWKRRLLASLAMGMTMEAVASSIATLSNRGLEHFVQNWQHAYVNALPLGIGMGLLMGFVVRPWIERRLARAAAGAAASPAIGAPSHGASA